MLAHGKTSESHPIDIQFVEGHWGDGKGVLGITFAPGKKQLNAISGVWNRDLQTDLKRIREHFKIDTIVCLIEDHEFTFLKIEDEFPVCEKLGISTFHHPIQDGYIPSDHSAFKKLVAHIVEE